MPWDINIKPQGQNKSCFWTYSEVLSFQCPRPPPTHPQADKTKKSVCFVLVWHVWQEVQKRNNKAGLAGLYSLFPHVKTKTPKGRGRWAGSSSFHKYHIPLHSNGTKWIRTINTPCPQFRIWNGRK